MPVVCPVFDKFATPSGTKTHTRVPTELLGKTSSRLYWLALVVMVTTVVLFPLRHVLDSEIRAIEDQPLFRISIALLIATPLAIIAVHRSGVLAP